MLPVTSHLHDLEQMAGIVREAFPKGTHIEDLPCPCVASYTTSALKQAARVELASEDYETSMLAIAPRLHFGGGGRSRTC